MSDGDDFNLRRCLESWFLLLISCGIEQSGKMRGPTPYLGRYLIRKGTVAHGENEVYHCLALKRSHSDTDSMHHGKRNESTDS
jgi:hypothetical protein